MKAFIFDHKQAAELYAGEKKTMKTRSEVATAYIADRFPDAGLPYIQQWQERFDRGEEWNYSDFAGRRKLQELHPEWYPADVEAFKVLPPLPAPHY
jgi:hypothetical protein